MSIRNTTSGLSSQPLIREAFKKLGDGLLDNGKQIAKDLGPKLARQAMDSGMNKLESRVASRSGAGSPAPRAALRGTLGKLAKLTRSPETASILRDFGNRLSALAEDTPPSPRTPAAAAARHDAPAGLAPHEPPSHTALGEPVSELPAQPAAGGFSTIRADFRQSASPGFGLLREAARDAFKAAKAEPRVASILGELKGIRHSFREMRKPAPDGTRGLGASNMRELAAQGMALGRQVAQLVQGEAMRSLLRSLFDASPSGHAPHAAPAATAATDGRAATPDAPPR